MALSVKICGVTSAEDARAAVECGADLLGVNFVPGSKRLVDVDVARAIADEVSSQVVLVGVVADLSIEKMRELKVAARLDLLQLHGNEAPPVLDALLPDAYKAIRVAEQADIERIHDYGGDRVLLDAKVAGALGGTGESFDWSLARGVSRKVIVAGGLSEKNVALAVRALDPWGVDVASGVEVSGQPRRKDPDKMREFVRLARSA